MKARFTTLLALTFLLGTASVRSQTLNWASLTQSEVVDSHGVALDQNTYVFELGAFTSGFTPQESNISLWATYWHVFDTASYTYDQNTSTGYFTGDEKVQNVPGYVGMFQGLSAYLFVRNSTDTEFFLARPGDTNAWKFPTLDPDCCPNGEVTTWSVSNLTTDAPIWGTQGGVEGGGIGIPGNYDLQTYAVPETSSSLLALIGGGFFLFHRRRENARDPGAALHPPS
ncbi:MAG: hypothetical protein ABIT37_15060 [Luteolibacter sp.]